MNDLTVVQHNDLIASSYRFDIDEMRLINLALTKVDSRNENIGMIDIYPEEFAEMFGLSKKNIWRNMKNSVLSIMKKPVQIQFMDEHGHRKERVINWLDEAIYYIDQTDCSKIQIEFSRKIEPYLFELHGNFTKINFEYASRLNTPFSFRLYQWLVREHRIKKGQYYDLTMTLDAIKASAQLGKSYPRWINFRNRVIAPAVDAINQKTNLSLSYTVTKQGGKVHALTFTYIDEMQKATNALDAGESFTFADQKPIRPRLLRRPKVTKGSHEEGEWQRANLAKLSMYQEQLKDWDNTAKLTIPDLRKLVEYSRLFASEIYNLAIKELEERTISHK
jgi:plasmid replication initiation protein